MFIWPLEDHIVTRDFYYLANIYVGGQHAALDLIRRIGATCAAPIRVIADGTVVGVGWDMYSGFFVAVEHADGWRSFYRHLYGQTPVIIGQQVSQGQIIGNVGNTGASQGDHLHFDLWNRNKIRNDNAIFFKRDWYAVDPELYLGKETEEDEMTPEQLKVITNLLEKIIDRDTQQAVALRQYVEAAARVTRGLSKKQIEQGLKNVLNAITNIPVSSGGMNEAQVEAVIARVLKRQKLIVQ